MIADQKRIVELDLIARFHVHPGEEILTESALREVAAASRAETGCLDFKVLQARRDPALFFIHSRWRDEAAFNRHADFDHTRRFIEVIESLVDRPPEIVRAEQVWPAQL